MIQNIITSRFFVNIVLFLGIWNISFNLHYTNVNRMNMKSFLLIYRSSNTALNRCVMFFFPNSVCLADRSVHLIHRQVREGTFARAAKQRQTKKKNYNNMINIRINWWRLMAINNIFIVLFSFSLTNFLTCFIFLFCWCGNCRCKQHTETHRPYGEIWFKDVYQLLFVCLFFVFAWKQNDTERATDWILLHFWLGSERIVLFLWNILSVSCNKISFHYSTQIKFRIIFERN